MTRPGSWTRCFRFVAARRGAAPKIAGWGASACSSCTHFWFYFIFVSFSFRKRTGRRSSCSLLCSTLPGSAAECLERRRVSSARQRVILELGVRGVLSHSKETVWLPGKMWGRWSVRCTGGSDSFTYKEVLELWIDIGF